MKTTWIYIYTNLKITLLTKEVAKEAVWYYTLFIWFKAENKVIYYFHIHIHNQISNHEKGICGILDIGYWEGQWNGVKEAFYEPTVWFFMDAKHRKRYLKSYLADTWQSIIFILKHCMKCFKRVKKKYVNSGCFMSDGTCTCESLFMNLFRI